jgi:hypothetical protein
MEEKMNTLLLIIASLLGLTFLLAFFVGKITFRLIKFRDL